MARIVKRSVAPIYLVGLVWLAYAVLFPLYRVSDYIICGVISAAFFLLGKTIWPDAVLIEDGEEPPAAPRSAPKAEEEPAADPEVAALLAERAKAERREASFQMVIDDVYAISKGRLVGRPR